MWHPSAKSINDIAAVLVQQNLNVSGNDLHLPDYLSFEREHLILSIARTRTLAASQSGLTHHEQLELIESVGREITTYIELFLQDNRPEFCLSERVAILADDERTSLAAKIGAAIADLLMERLDFHWRANARDLFLTSTEFLSASTKIPDFAYDPGARHGFEQQSVVLVEAKGSLSRTRGKRNRILKLAQNAFNQQVRDYIGKTSGDLTVGGGYAVAFGTIPGSEVSTLAIASPQQMIIDPTSLERASSLSAASLAAQQQIANQTEQQVTQAPYSRLGGGGSGRGGGERREEGERAQPTGRVAFANYEAVFRLCGAEKAAAHLRRILAGQSTDGLSEDQLVQEFRVINQGGGRFLTSMGSYSWDGSGTFAIDEKSASRILQSAAAHLDAPPSSVSIPIVPVDRRRRAVVDADGAIDGDGLALLLLPTHDEWVSWNLLDPPEI
jgi:hypothetical protein